jgi:hypothetical protein
LGDSLDLIVHNLLRIILVLWAVWTIIDGFTIYRRTKKANYRSLLRALKSSGVNSGGKILKTAKQDSNKDNKSEEYRLWKEKNPNSTLNDYYRTKKH